MSDDVKQVAERILDRTKGQVRTHSTDCHEYHLECFAAFVLRQLPDVVREAKAEVWDEGFNAGWDVWDAKTRNPYRTEGEPTSAEYTPTIDEVRKAWGQAHNYAWVAFEEFERFLAARDAEQQRIGVQALAERMLSDETWDFLSGWNDDNDESLTRAQAIALVEAALAVATETPTTEEFDS